VVSEEGNSLPLFRAPSHASERTLGTTEVSSRPRQKSLPFVTVRVFPFLASLYFSLR
jgi:hypothetical protein